MLKSPPPPPMLCVVCKVVSPNLCQRCKQVAYCCPAHQKEDWKVHKSACQGSSKGMTSPTSPTTTSSKPPPVVAPPTPLRQCSELLLPVLRCLGKHGGHCDLVRDLALLSKASWEDEELWGTIKDVPGPGGRTRLMYAAIFGLLVRAQWLLDRGANVNASLEGGCTPLMLASQHGEESMVDKLAFNKARLDEVCRGPEGDTSTALMMACHAGHYHVALSLCAWGADPNVAGRLSGYTALMWAIRENHAIIVGDLLKDPHVSPHTRCAGGMTALMLAAELGRLELVAEMCDSSRHSASLNDTDEDGANALLWACQMGHEEVAFFLTTQEGVQVDVTRASDGMTPLLWAATRGWEIVVEGLCKEGVEVNVRETSTGRTPLMMAAANGDVRVLHTLYLHGADTELATRKEGMTALMLAAFQGHLEEVVYLVDEGKANIDAVDKRGFTALFWAKLCKRGEVVRFLQSKNAKGSATKVVVMPESSGAGEAGGGDGQV